MTRNAVNDRELFKTTSINMRRALMESEKINVLIRETIQNFDNQPEELSHRAAKIIEAAVDLFGGDLSKAIGWCNSPASFTGSSSTPLSMTGSNRELALVLDSIGRLKHGIPL